MAGFFSQKRVNSFSFTKGFLSLITWNARRINTDIKDFKKYNDKKLFIINICERLKPDIFFIIDIGPKANFEINTYRQIYTRDHNNLLLIKKEIAFDYKLINQDIIIVDNKYIFTYYKPNDDSKKYLLLNYIYNKYIILDMNFKSHSKKIKLNNHKIMFEKHSDPKFKINSNKQLTFWNCRFCDFSSFKMIKDNFSYNYSDHIPIRILIKERVYINKSKNYNELITKKNALFITNNVNKLLKGNININDFKLIMNKNFNSKIKINNKKIISKLNDINNDNDYYNKLVNNVNHKLEYKNDSSTFKLVNRLLKYKKREEFLGMRIDENYTDQYKRIIKGEYVSEKEFDKKTIFDELDNISKIHNSIWNYNYDLKTYKTYLNNNYSKANDSTGICTRNVAKMEKNWYKKYQKEFQGINIDYGFIYNKLIKDIKLMAEISNNTISTFFLDKKKGTNSIEDFRVIGICPSFVKLYELVNYNIICNEIQSKIDKYTNNLQFGFKKNASTYEAINYLLKNNNKIKRPICILIDFYRAYEGVCRQKLNQYFEKKIFKINNKIQIAKNNNKMKDVNKYTRKLLIWNICKTWITLNDNLFTTINNKNIFSNYGVIMGLKLAPLMFNLYYSIAFKEFVKKYKNEMIMLLYADDTILLIERENCETILREFNSICNNINFTINKKKSEILYNEEMDYITMQVIDKIKKEYHFEKKINARYLGKWVKIDCSGHINEGEDEVKTIGSTKYFKKMSYELIMKFFFMYISSRSRYNFINETRKFHLKSIFNTWFKKYLFLCHLKKNSKITFMFNINWFKIMISKFYLTKFDGDKYSFIIDKIKEITLDVLDYKNNYYLKNLMEDIFTNAKKTAETKYDGLPIEINRNNKNKITKIIFEIINENIKNNNLVMSLFFNPYTNKNEILNKIYKLNLNQCNTSLFLKFCFNLLFVLTIETRSKEENNKLIDIIFNNDNLDINFNINDICNNIDNLHNNNNYKIDIETINEYWLKKYDDRENIFKEIEIKENKIKEKIKNNKIVIKEFKKNEINKIININKEINFINKIRYDEIYNKIEINKYNNEILKNLDLINKEFITLKTWINEKVNKIKKVSLEEYIKSNSNKKLLDYINNNKIIISNRNELEKELKQKNNNKAKINKLLKYRIEYNNSNSNLKLIKKWRRILNLIIQENKDSFNEIFTKDFELIKRNKLEENISFNFKLDIKLEKNLIKNFKEKWKNYEQIEKIKYNYKIKNIKKDKRLGWITNNVKN